MALLHALEQAEAVDPDGAVGISFLLSIPLLLATAAVSTLMNLGAFRLCLDRGEGKPGAMPWTIFKEGRRYIGWAVWMGIFPVVWRTGKRAGRVVLGNVMDHIAFAKFNLCMNYWNGALTFLSLVLFMLLNLSIKAAYLRSPEQGFWRAMGFGLKEGLGKWPRTIGAQMKFVVPVSVGTSMISILLSRLSFGTENSGLSQFYSLAGSIIGLLAETWILIFYGILAAWRYAPPDWAPQTEK